jgi:hypothetical protein
MLSLADTSIRMYRKKNGLVSLRLKSYLLIHTGASFSLTAYLRKLSCQLTLSSGQIVSMEASYTTHVAHRCFCGTDVQGGHKVANALIEA